MTALEKGPIRRWLRLYEVLRVEPLRSEGTGVLIKEEETPELAHSLLLKHSFIHSFICSADFSRGPVLRSSDQTPSVSSVCRHVGGDTGGEHGGPLQGAVVEGKSGFLSMEKELVWQGPSPPSPLPTVREQPL